jgi:hypothetical protein
MLDAKEASSSTTIDASSIKFCREGKTLGTFLILKTWIL